MDTSNLPNDATDLKGIIADYQVEIEYPEEKVRFLKAQLFGRKSEKRSSNWDQQMAIFNEAEEAASEEAIPEITVPAHTRKKPGRTAAS